MPSIPKSAFRIWYGSDLPEGYRHALLDLKKHNPDYTITLFSAPMSMSDKAYQSLRAFCLAQEITVVDIQTHDSPYALLVVDELKKAQATPSLAIKKIHYARASDITRMVELYENGGIYTDTDIEVIGPFGELTSASCLSFAAYGLPTLWYQAVDESYRHHVKGVCYDFIAAEKGHPVFEYALKIHQLDIETQEAFNDFSLSAYGRLALRRYVIETTGGLLYHALNYAIQKGEIADVPSLFYETAHCLNRKTDNSWLSEGEPLEVDSHAITRFESFLTDIQRPRLKAFPIKHPELKLQDHVPAKSRAVPSGNARLFSIDAPPLNRTCFLVRLKPRLSFIRLELISSRIMTLILSVI